MYCVALNFVNIVVQVLATNYFLNFNFVLYGYRYSYADEAERKAQDVFFPKMSK